MDLIDKIIQQAQERGEFKNLEGEGKPLDLRPNPWVPPDLQMAYRMLEQAGFAPDVVDDDKSLRARIADLDTRLDRFARTWQSWPLAVQQERVDRRDTFLRDYEEEIRSINNRIHAFNMMAPRLMNRGTLPTSILVEKARARLQLGA
jgi:hypothetical protein